MCVDTKGYSWERPAERSDIAILEKHFSGVDFQGLLEAMSKDGAKPLTSDLVLVGAMANTQPDDLGMREVPFCGVEHGTRTVVKLPVMDQIVEWLENSALGTDMWQNASEWAEKNHGARFHFAMNCGCGLVANAARESGKWQIWKERFNRSRAHLYGQTRVVRRNIDSIAGLSMTQAQLDMWFRMRECLEALPHGATDLQEAA